MKSLDNERGSGLLITILISMTAFGVLSYSILHITDVRNRKQRGIQQLELAMAIEKQFRFLLTGKGCTSFLQDKPSRPGNEIWRFQESSPGSQLVFYRTQKLDYSNYLGSDSETSITGEGLLKIQSIVLDIKEDTDPIPAELTVNFLKSQPTFGPPIIARKIPIYHTTYTVTPFGKRMRDCSVSSLSSELMTFCTQELQGQNIFNNCKHLRLDGTIESGFLKANNRLEFYNGIINGNVKMSEANRLAVYSATKPIDVRQVMTVIGSVDVKKLRVKDKFVITDTMKGSLIPTLRLCYDNGSCNYHTLSGCQCIKVNLWPGKKCPPNQRIASLTLNLTRNEFINCVPW